MDNFRIHQNSSSIAEYVDGFMHVKNRAEFIFKRKFDDDLLSYCFVKGLKEEFRDALELWAPRTLQEAIILAKYQELLLEESLMVVNAEIESEKGPVINYCVKNLSAELCRKEKPMVAEDLPAMINNKRQTPNDYVLQTIKKLITTIDSADLGMKPGNNSEEKVLIFDPGGGLSHRQDIIELPYILEDNDPLGAIFGLLDARDDILQHVCHSIIKINVMLKAAKMCLAFDATGFTLSDVTSSDFLGGAMSGDKVFGLMLAGIFHSYEETAAGVCTRDQLGRLLKWINGHEGGGSVRFKLVAATMDEQRILFNNISRAPNHTPWIWTEVFTSGTSGCGETMFKWAHQHNYLVSSIAKRMATAWYWSIAILIFDPGDFIYSHPEVSCYQLRIIGSSLRTRMFLRGMDCNQQERLDLEVFIRSWPS